jgi:hypothetical protein
MMKTLLWLFSLFLMISCNPVEQKGHGQADAILANTIFLVCPYRYHGTWVFDDPRVGLVREPFVAGIPEMIDKLVKDMPDAEKGFRLLFSATPFPGHTIKVVWRRAEAGGSWYYCEEYDSEGWLCPALFKYFNEAPKEIYIRAEKK